MGPHHHFCTTDFNDRHLSDVCRAHSSMLKAKDLFTGQASLRGAVVEGSSPTNSHSFVLITEQEVICSHFVLLWFNSLLTSVTSSSAHISW